MIFVSRYKTGGSSAKIIQFYMIELMMLCSGEVKLVIMTRYRIKGSRGDNEVRNSFVVNVAGQPHATPYSVNLSNEATSRSTRDRVSDLA